MSDWPDPSPMAMVPGVVMSGYVWHRCTGLRALVVAP